MYTCEISFGKTRKVSVKLSHRPPAKIHVTKLQVGILFRA